MSLRSEQLAKPRANPADVQAIVDLWKQKYPTVAKDRGLFREWAYLVCNHWFPCKGPFDPGSWSEEDVQKCRAALEAMA